MANETVKNECATTEVTSETETETEITVDECIEQNIQINSNKQMRVEYLYPWTLKFKDATQETKYCQLREDMFRSNMLCVFIVWIFIVLCQAIIIPRCTVLMVSLAMSTIVLTGGCILVMAEEFSTLPQLLKNSSKSLVHQRNFRTIFTVLVIILMSIASSIGLFVCPLKEILPNKTCHHQDTHPISIDGYGPEESPTVQTKVLQFAANTLNAIRSEDDEKMTINEAKSINLPSTNVSSHFCKRYLDISGDITNSPEATEICVHPEYLVFTWVLCLTALATGLKLYYLVKTTLASIIICCYAVLIIVVFPDVFVDITDESPEYVEYGMTLVNRMSILLVIFLVMVTYHARLVEVTSRLDFIWKEQAEKELSNMKSNRILNDLLIKVSVLGLMTDIDDHGDNINILFLFYLLYFYVRLSRRPEYFTRSRGQLLFVRRPVRSALCKNAQFMRCNVCINTEFQGLLFGRH